MKRGLKWLGYVLLLLITLGGITIGGAYYYKSDILRAINQELRKSINGDVALGDVTFSLWDEYPGLTINLHDIYLRGPHYDRYGKDFLNARKVRISVRLMPLLKKTLVVRSIRITDGSLFIYRTKTGETNLDVFKGKEVNDTVRNQDPMLVLLRKVRLEDIHFSFQDTLKGKSLEFQLDDLKGEINQSDTSNIFALTGPVSFQGLLFNPALGSYLKGKKAEVRWNLEFKPAAQQLIIRPSTMVISGYTLKLEGLFDFVKPGKFFLNVGSDRLDYQEGISLLTEALQSKLVKIKIEKPVEVTATVKGQLAGGAQPEVLVKFKLKDTHFNAFGIACDKATASGSFFNRVDSTRLCDDHNSWVKLDNFEGDFQGLTTHLTATLRDLIDPNIQIASTMDVPLRKFRPLVDSSQFRLKSGKLSSRVEYSGKLHEFLDSAKTSLKGKLAGAAQITDGVFDYLPRRHSYEKVNVALHFDQHHVGIENVSFSINKNPIVLKGELLGFVPFVVVPGKNAEAVLSIYSPSLNMQTLLTKAEPKKKVPGPAAAPTTVDDFIEKVIERVRFELNVQLDRLIYDKMNGAGVSGKFVLKDYTLEGQNIKMKLADGNIQFAMSVSNLNKPVSTFWVKSIMRHADIKKVFYSFNNFKMTTLKYDNLEGKVDMESIFSSQFDDNFDLLVPTMYGTLDLVLTDGKLIDFEPLENMSNFLFKKRDFSNVSFGEIRTHIGFQGKEFDIRKMEIESTVLRLFVEGRYSLAGHTDLEVQVPLSNLKKRNKDYKPENVGVDQKVGPSVFLHVHNDEKGNTVIAYDPFKKHVKKAEEKKKSAKKSGKR